MQFSATEVGFADGMGGASNALTKNAYHYVLFGIQTDLQHPENSGAYFEYDDQINGDVNCVKEIVVGDKMVEFRLTNGETITVNCKAEPGQWDEFIHGVRSVFDSDRITPA